MARPASVKRYAQAIFEIALERKELEKWRADLGILAQILADPQLVALLENPKLSPQEKRNLLDELLTGVNPLVKNLAYLLVSRNHLRMMADLAAEYERLVDAYHGIEHAEVITAIPLDPEEKKELEQRLSGLRGKKIVLTNKLDPDLLGGLVVRVGDKLIDGSVRTRLQKLKESLVGSR
jgi:F-type H+-transporting ATPase subunit delta